MQTFTVQNNAALDSPSIPGRPVGLKAFRNWISDAEKMETVDLKEAKSKWAGKRKQLQKLTK